MHFFRSLSLRAQLMLVVIVIVLAGFALTLTVLTRQAAQLQEGTALDYAQEVASRDGNAAATRLRQALETARTLADALQGLQQSGHATRAQGDQMLRAILERHPQYVGIWAGWEPNAFDGKDSELAGQPGTDASGRYLPQFSRDGTSNAITRDVLVDYDKSGPGDYYQIPKASGKSALLEPYRYMFSGKEMLLTTVSVPLIAQGRFLGVAGVDLALSDLQEAVRDIRLYGNGYGSLLSHAGMLVGDRDDANVGRQVGASSGLDAQQLAALRDALRSGQPYRASFNDPRLQTHASYLVAPIAFEGLDTPWAFAATVATDQVLKDIRALQWKAALLGLASIVLTSLGLALALDRLVLRPIGGEPSVAVALAERVARGDLSQPVTVRAGDDASLMAQLKHMQDSLSSVVSHVRTGAHGVATASTQISAGNHDLSGRTESQASALEQTAASMEELSATVRQNADNARQANELAQSARTVAEHGGEVVNQVVQTMKGMDESAHRIADIIGVIDGIAFQTNILALNAAVEAARAGEQGRGFAVVAGEVRALAGRSAEAAKEIKQLITASVERSEAGAALVDQAGTTMQEVVAGVRRVTDLMSEISAASNEQSQGVSQIGAAVTQMDQATQQNAALVEEMAAAASSLNQQADALVQTVAVFQLAGAARA